MTINGSVTGAAGTIDIAGGGVFIGAQVAAGETINFNGTGNLFLADAEEFKGEVKGFAAGDRVYLRDFAFADTPTISVSGSDAAGGITRVKITDGARVAKIALVNQYAGEFAINRSAYQLVSDNLGAMPARFSSSPGLTAKSEVSSDASYSARSFAGPSSAGSTRKVQSSV